jgi:choline-sulfatase
MVRAPGVAAGRRRALTTAPDFAPTILELTGIAASDGMQGTSFAPAIADDVEHRPFVISSWPLYFAEGELTSAVDSRPRRIASYMPITATTRELSLILGGPTEAPELYDLAADPGEERNVWDDRPEGVELCRKAVAFLEEYAADERFVEPRRGALQAFGGRA